MFITQNNLEYVRLSSYIFIFSYINCTEIAVFSFNSIVESFPHVGTRNVKLHT